MDLLLSTLGKFYVVTIIHKADHAQLHTVQSIRVAIRCRVRQLVIAIKYNAREKAPYHRGVTTSLTCTIDGVVITVGIAGCGYSQCRSSAIFCHFQATLN
jgi:hypothetical protein